MDKNVLNASLIKWQHQPLEIITNEPAKLEVILQGEFILTGTIANLSLSLNYKNGQWVTNKSFYPQEQQEYACYETSSLVYKALYSSNNLRKIHKTHTGRNL